MYEDPYRDPEQGRLVDIAVEVRHQTADAILVLTVTTKPGCQKA